MDYHQTGLNAKAGPVFESVISPEKARHLPTSKYAPHQGFRECARRRGELGWGARK